jgi:hypothetical protein
MSATSQGTDVPGLLANGFEQTQLVVRDNVTVGYFQAVILTFGADPVVIPLSPFFRTSRASYNISGGACATQQGEVTTRIDFTNDLGANPNRPVDTVLTVVGLSVTPTRIQGTDVKIACGVAGGNLVLSFDTTDCDLVADQASTFPLKVRIGNTAQSGTVGFLGWSYGIQLDAAELEATAYSPGADAQALKGGAGPDFTSFDLDDRSADGSARGVTVGVVIDLGPPGTAVLSVPGGSTKHTDTITLRSRQAIPAGGTARTSALHFVSDVLGGGPLRDPIEIIFNSGGNSLTPDSTATKTLNLLPAEQGARPRFIRSDANNDGRPDIADGVWIINDLLDSGPATACPAAADANGDGKFIGKAGTSMMDILMDAMYIFNYQLQVGATPGSLRPAPPAPFPVCGTADNVTFAECPQGSTTCP